MDEKAYTSATDDANLKNDTILTDEKTHSAPLVQDVKKDKPPQKRRAGFIALCVATAVVFFICGALTSWWMLDPQMRSLVRLKNKIQKEYYYTVDDDTFYDTLFGAVNTYVLDGYSEYLTADEYEKMQLEGQGNQTGIGVIISKVETDGFPPLRIMRVCGNSPAEAAGLQAGEYIVGVGATAENIAPTATFEAFSTALSAFADATDIYLHVRSGESVRTVCVQKQAYVENYVFYRTSTSAYRFAGQGALQKQEYTAPLSQLPGNAAYIRLTQFNGNALQQFEQAMSLFKQDGKQILVLDLRQNGGGYVHISTEIAAYFCKESISQQPVVAIADYGEQKTYFQASKNVYSSYFSADSKIYVLADDGTASASEMLLGCMLDYGAIAYSDICLVDKNGVAKTYGKGIMQTTFPFGAGHTDAVKLTTARIVWPQSNTCIHDVGITKANGTKTVKANAFDEIELQSALSVLFG